MKQVICLDAYSKIILTIIAVCLVMLVFRPNLAPELVHAYGDRGIANEQEYPKININIGQIGGQDLEPGAGIPVRIVE